MTNPWPLRGDSSPSNPSSPSIDPAGSASPTTSPIVPPIVPPIAQATTGQVSGPISGQVSGPISAQVSEQASAQISAQISAQLDDRLTFPKMIAIPALERRDYAMQTWLFSGVFWMVVAASLGVIEAVKLFYPEFLQGIPALAYGRLRPVHVNLGIFGFMSMGYLGAAFYMVPRLTQTALYSETLGVLTAWGWNLNLLGGVLAILLGFSKGKEYEELPFPFDMMIGILEILIAGNLFSTITVRKESRLYVSLWYVLLAIIPFPIYYTLGNVMNFRGIEDAIVNWFYSHNLFGLWLTTLGLATLYYIVPKQLNKPLYSHAISFLGFWTLAAFYPWNGGHHVIWGPVPDWVMTASVTASIAMLIPTIATMVNFGGTAWGTQGVMKRDISYRFSIVAYLSYVGTSLWGSTLAIMGLNAKLHFTSTTIAHVHLGFVGFGIAGLAAFIYFYLERSLKKGYSRTLAEWHFWLTVAGTIGYVVSMGWLGWLEGSEWTTGNSVQGVLALRYGYNVARASSGGLLLIGQVLLVVNIWKTMTSPPRDPDGEHPDLVLNANHQNESSNLNQEATA